MNFERGLYSEGWHVLKQCMPYAALAVGGEYAIQAFREVTGIGVGATLVASVLIWAYLAYSAHAAVLLPADRDKTADGKRMFGFALRTFGLFLLVFIPTMIPILLIAFGSGQILAGHEMIVTFVLLVLLVGGLLWLLVFAFLGTLLPAFVADQQRGLGEAFARGRRQFFWITGRLLIGPGLVSCLSFTIVLFPVWQFDSDGDFLTSGYLPDPVTTLPGLLAYGVQTYATVLAAVVLSRAFLRDETHMSGQAD